MFEKDYVISKDRLNKAIEDLKLIDEDGDTEQAHVDADDVLVNLLPEEIGKYFDKISKWYA